MAYIRQNGDMISAPFGDNIIEQGQLVTVDTGGNAKAGETGTKAFLGVADESTKDVLNSVIRIRTEGAFQMSIASATATDLGKAVAIANPTTVTTTTNSATVIGQIVEIVDSKTVMVKLK